MLPNRPIRTVKMLFPTYHVPSPPSLSSWLLRCPVPGWLAVPWIHCSYPPPPLTPHLERQPGSLPCQPPSHNQLPAQFLYLPFKTQLKHHLLCALLDSSRQNYLLHLWATQHLVFNLYNYTYHIFSIHSDYALSPSLNCELLKTAIFISYWLLELNLIWNKQFLYDC